MGKEFFFYRSINKKKKIEELGRINIALFYNVLYTLMELSYFMYINV